MNLGLVMSLSFLNLTSDKENNRRVINEAIEETKNGMYLVCLTQWMKSLMMVIYKGGYSNDSGIKSR